MQTPINNNQPIEVLISELLSGLNIPLLPFRHFPKNLNRVLQTIGKFSRHDRIEIIEVHHNMTFTILHEWCDTEIPAIPEKWKHAAIIYDIPLEEQLCTRNYIILRKAPEHPNPRLTEMLQEQHCHQMLILPLFESGSQFAFIGFGQCKQAHNWSEEEIRLLSSLSSIIASQLNNYYLIDRLLRRVQKKRQVHEETTLLQSRLKTLHTDLVPAWNQLKNTAPETVQQSTEFTDMDRHINTLNQICHSLFDK